MSTLAEQRIALVAKHMAWKSPTISRQRCRRSTTRATSFLEAARCSTGQRPCWSISRPRGLATYLFPIAARVLGYHDGRLGFGGKEARTLMTQWAHLTRTGVWDVPGWDIEGHLRACETSVLAVRIEGDEYAPERAVEHLLGKIPAARIERAVWSGPEPRTAYIRWPRTPDHVAELASRFVSRRG